jgi:hypothetical protein
MSSNLRCIFREYSFPFRFWTKTSQALLTDHIPASCPTLSSVLYLITLIIYCCLIRVTQYQNYARLNTRKLGKKWRFLEICNYHTGVNEDSKLLGASTTFCWLVNTESAFYCSPEYHLYHGISWWIRAAVCCSTVIDTLQLSLFRMIVMPPFPEFLRHHGPSKSWYLPVETALWKKI